MKFRYTTAAFLFLFRSRDVQRGVQVEKRCVCRHRREYVVLVFDLLYLCRSHTPNEKKELRPTRLSGVLSVPVLGIS